MIETSVTYVSSQTSVNVLRIEVSAMASGIATAGSVPNTNSENHQRSEAADQRLRQHARARPAAARRVVERQEPGEVRLDARAARSPAARLARS